MKIHPFLAAGAAATLILTACSSGDQNTQASLGASTTSHSASATPSITPTTTPAKTATVSTAPATSSVPTWGTTTTSSPETGSITTAESTDGANTAAEGPTPGEGGGQNNQQQPAEKVAQVGESCGTIDPQGGLRSAANLVVQNGAVACERAVTVMSEFVSVPVTADNSGRPYGAQNIQDAHCYWNPVRSGAGYIAEPECTAGNGAVKFTGRVTDPAAQQQPDAGAPQPGASASSTKAQ